MQMQSGGNEDIFAQTNYYFVTLCTEKNKPLLSQITEQAPVKKQLSEYGKIVLEELIAIDKRFSNVRIDNYVIMPNHVHLIVAMEPSKKKCAPTLLDVVNALVSLSQQGCMQAGFRDILFETRFHEHRILDYTEYELIWNYIEKNPSTWHEDRYYCQ